MYDVITPTIENDEVELLIIASIQTLKRKNKRCGRDEVFELVKDSTDHDTVTKETFDKLLNQLTNSNSVKLNTVGNRECLSLPTKSNKRDQQNHMENHFIVENCFKNLKSVITDEFESHKGKKILNCKSTLKTIRDGNLNKLIFAHLNINSIRNKFEELISQVKGTVDVLMISDDSVPIVNLLIDSFSQPYMIDRNSSGGGIMLYVREDIPSNLLKVESLPIEGFYVELKL